MRSRRTFLTLPKTANSAHSHVGKAVLVTSQAFSYAASFVFVDFQRHHVGRLPSSPAERRRLSYGGRFNGDEIPIKSDGTNFGDDEMPTSQQRRRGDDDSVSLGNSFRNALHQLRKRQHAAGKRN